MWSITRRSLFAPALARSAVVGYLINAPVGMLRGHCRRNAFPTANRHRASCFQDPLISVVVRVRWTGLRGGMAEENALFSTLDPMHGARRLAPSFGRGNDVGVCAGQWFVTAR